MTVLLALALLPIVLALILARGEPVRTISCLGAMGVGCVIACSSVVGLFRHPLRHASTVQRGGRARLRV